MKCMQLLTIAAVLTTSSIIATEEYLNFELYNPSKSYTLYYQIRYKDADKKPIDVSGGKWLALAPDEELPVPFSQWLDVFVASDETGKDAQLYTFYYNPKNPKKVYYIAANIKPDKTIVAYPQNMRLATIQTKVRELGIPKNANITAKDLKKAKDIIQKEKGHLKPFKK